MWDNANIVESFPGVTTPLTFSVAQEAYGLVYRRACAALGVRSSVIRAHDEVFDGLLGLVAGRVYYDVGAWHRVLALLPGFRANQRYLERMMGAARPGAGTGERAARVGSGVAGIGALLILARGLIALALFDRHARRFVAQQATLLARERALQVRDVPPSLLVARYEAARDQALGRWQAPIFNDIFVMVFSGALRSAVLRWCDGEAGAVAARQLRVSGHPAAAAAAALRAIADRVRTDPAWLAALDSLEADGFDAGLECAPALRGLQECLADYLAEWGDRGPGALQLDRPGLADRPRVLLATIRDLATASPIAEPPHRTEDVDVAPRLVAALRGTSPTRILRGAVLRWLVGRVRYHMTWRESMRLVRMDVFGLARRLFAEVDRAWVRDGMLAASGDIHYLTLDDIGGVIAGRTGPAALKDLVDRRRTTVARWRQVEPPGRFESVGPTRGGVVDWPAEGVPGGEPPPTETSSILPEEHGLEPAVDAQTLRGLGVSGGLVRGRCLVVSDPLRAGSVGGRILVARSTDPGWLPILLAAAGLLVEFGGVLSHSAIVARELALPAVVGIPDLMDRLATDDEVEIDGTTGVVRILEHGGPSASADRGRNA